MFCNLATDRLERGLEMSDCSDQQKRLYAKQILYFCNSGRRKSDRRKRHRLTRTSFGY